MQLPQLLRQLEYCCCMPRSWRLDIGPQQQPLQDQQPHHHQLQHEALSDEASRQEPPTGCKENTACNSSNSSVRCIAGSYSFVRPLCGTQREVHLPNGTFPAVGVEALELLTLVKGLLRTQSEVRIQ